MLDARTGQWIISINIVTCSINKMKALEIRRVLDGWNVEVRVGLNEEFYDLLQRAYPNWIHSREFSQIDIEVVEHPYDHGMLYRNGRDYIGLFPQKIVTNFDRKFQEVGLIVIGGGGNGDPLVLDTQSETEEAVGFIEHSSLIELNQPARSCYKQVASTLVEYLERLNGDPECPTEHPGFTDSRSPWLQFMKKSAEIAEKIEQDDFPNSLRSPEI